MAGEELPPVVGVLEGDIAGWLASLDEAWGAYEAFAEKMSGQSVDLGGIAAPDMLATGEAMGAQLSEGIAEGAAGLDLAPEVDASLAGTADAAQAAGSEIASGITDAVEAGSEQAGASLAAAIRDGAAAGADEAQAVLGASFTAPVVQEFDQTGIQAGAAFASGFAVSADIGEAVKIALTGATISTILGSGLGGSGAANALTASLVDAATEAGGAAGDALIAAMGDSAAQGAPAVAAGLGDAVQGALDDAMLQAGVSAGDALTAGLDSVSQDAVAAAGATGQAIVQEEADAMAATRAVVQQMAEGLPEPFISAYLAIRDGEQAAEEDLARLSGAGQAALVRLQSIVEEYGLQVADAAAATMQLNALPGMVSATPTMAAETPAAAQLAGPQVSVPGLAVASESKAAAAGMQEVAAASTEAEAAVGGVGAAMGGPLMWGLLGVASLLPMVGSLFNSGSQAAQAYAQQQQQLQQAVSQDSDMIGANTVATIANQLATSGAADTLQGYGVSLSDATAAMAGVKSAQTDVNGTINEQIDNLQSLIQEQSAHSQGVSTDIENERQQVQQLQATRDAMQQLENDVVSAVQHQNELTQATIYAEQAADVFNVQVRAGVLALQQSAQQANVNAAALGAYDMTLVSSSTAYKNAVNDQAIALANSAIQAGINAQALNQSLGPQAQLSSEALTAAVNYQQAGTATGQYTNALTALYGQYGQTSGALATANLAVSNLSGTITSGKDAVNLYTQAGDKNFQQFQSAAQAAETYAEKLYQQTGDTDQATQALQTFAEKIDHAAAEAHLTKGQIDQLNTALFGVPDVKDITIKLDPNSAEAQMSALDSFIQGEINSINNTPISPPVSIGGHPLSVRDTGGPVQQGTPYAIGLNGKPEVFVPGADGYITPMDMLAPAGYSGSPALGPMAYGATDGSAPIVNVYIDGRLVTAGVRSTSQQYKVRNALTGLT